MAPVSASTSPPNVRPLRVPEPGAAHVRAVDTGVPVSRVAVVHIEVFDDVEVVGQRYRSGQPILFDLSGTEPSTARRVLDFVSGLTYALRGRLRKAGSRAFLLIPDGIEVSAEERRRLANLGYAVTPGGEG